jgi:hypothetical protein
MNKTTENFLAAIKNYTPPQVEQTVYKLVYNMVYRRNKANTYASD